MIELTIVSIPVLVQNRLPNFTLDSIPARVAKLVDAGDSKSPGRNTVSVRVRSRVPLFINQQIVGEKPRHLSCDLLETLTGTP